MSVGMRNKLSPMQEAFVREYCVDRNVTEAAVRAGYSLGNRASAQVSGSKCMQLPKVQRAIEKKMRQLAEKTDTSSVWVRRKLKQEAENYAKGANPAARVRAIELIGKLNGDFVEDRKNQRTPLQDFDTAALERLEKELADLPAEPGADAAPPTTH